MRTFYALFFFFSLTTGLWAQQLTHGPVTGAVGPDSARIYVRTDSPTQVTIEASSDGFANVDASVSGMTMAWRDNSNILTLTGLQPYTDYELRVVINGTTLETDSKFRSAPAPDAPGNYTFLSGSCIGELLDQDTTLFTQATSEDADMMFFYGDWGYPDNDNDALSLTYPFLGGFPPYPDPTSYAEDTALIEEAYRNRYASTNSGKFVRSLALAYTWDDHDYLNDNSGANFAGGYFINDIFQPYAPSWADALGAPISIPQPPVCRLNLIKNYVKYFPGYTPADTSRGIYHSFKYGNAEFFFLDTRANRSPQHDNIREDNGEWEYQTPPGNSILGQEQLNWLIDGIVNSTADWKFIITSVTFNVGNQAPFDSVLIAGDAQVPILGAQLPGIPINATGYIIASRFADKWVGYPSDLQALLDTVVSPDNPSQAIKNVFMVSGDTHNSALDDGTHSGIPELMAGQLKRSNRREARETQDYLGYNIWNKGGSGLCTEDNYSTNYGKIQVFGQDSVRLSAVDAQGNDIFAHTFAYDQDYRYDPNATPNFQPVTQEDSYTIQDTTPQLVMDVLANDTDPEGDDMFVLIKELPQSGTLTLDPLTNELTYVPDQPGNYAFIYKACDTYDPDCPSCVEQTATIEVQQAVSRPENMLPQQVSFTVFPNPAWTTVTIRPEGNTGKAFQLQLLNGLGQELKTVPVRGQTQMSVTDLPGGYYLYRIVDQDGNLHQTGRINVQH